MGVRITDELVITARWQDRGVSQGTNQVQTDLKRVEGATQNVTAGLSRMVGMLGLALSTRELIRYADTWTQIGNRIGMFTKSGEEALRVQQALFQVAQGSRAPIAETVELYQRLSQNADKLGLSQERIIHLTETINKAMVISGVSTESARAALIQLGQAMGSGVLRGDEFNSIMEQAPVIQRAMMDSLGKTSGELRKMAEAGQLSAQLVIDAMEKAAGGIDAKFDHTTSTISQSLTRLSNAFGKFVHEGDDSIGATHALAGGFNALADNIENAAHAVEFLALTMAAVRLPALLGGALALLAAPEAAIPVLKAGGIVATGIAGYKAIQWAHDQYQQYENHNDYASYSMKPPTWREPYWDRKRGFEGQDYQWDEPSPPEAPPRPAFSFSRYQAGPFWDGVDHRRESIFPPLPPTPPKPDITRITKLFDDFYEQAAKEEMARFIQQHREAPSDYGPRPAGFHGEYQSVDHPVQRSGGRQTLEYAQAMGSGGLSWEEGKRKLALDQQLAGQEEVLRQRYADQEIGELRQHAQSMANANSAGYATENDRALQHGAELAVINAQWQEETRQANISYNQKLAEISKSYLDKTSSEDLQAKRRLIDTAGKENEADVKLAAERARLATLTTTQTEHLATENRKRQETITILSQSAQALSGLSPKLDGLTSTAIGMYESLSRLNAAGQITPDWFGAGALALHALLSVFGKSESEMQRLQKTMLRVAEASERAADAVGQFSRSTEDLTHTKLEQTSRAGANFRTLLDKALGYRPKGTEITDDTIQNSLALLFDNKGNDSGKAFQRTLSGNLGISVEELQAQITEILHTFKGLSLDPSSMQDYQAALDIGTQSQAQLDAFGTVLTNTFDGAMAMFQHLQQVLHPETVAETQALLQKSFEQIGNFDFGQGDFQKAFKPVVDTAGQSVVDMTSRQYMDLEETLADLRMKAAKDAYERLARFYEDAENRKIADQFAGDHLQLRIRAQQDYLKAGADPYAQAAVFKQLVADTEELMRDEVSAKQKAQDERQYQASQGNYSLPGVGAGSAGQGGGGTGGTGGGGSGAVDVGANLSISPVHLLGSDLVQYPSLEELESYLSLPVSHAVQNVLYEEEQSLARWGGMHLLPAMLVKRPDQIELSFYLADLLPGPMGRALNAVLTALPGGLVESKAITPAIFPPSMLVAPTSQTDLFARFADNDVLYNPVKGALNRVLLALPGSLRDGKAISPAVFPAPMLVGATSEGDFWSRFADGEVLYDPMRGALNRVLLALPGSLRDNKGVTSAVFPASMLIGAGSQSDFEFRFLDGDVLYNPMKGALNKVLAALPGNFLANKAINSTVFPPSMLIGAGSQGDFWSRFADGEVLYNPAKAALNLYLAGLPGALQNDKALKPAVFAAPMLVGATSEGDFSAHFWKTLYWPIANGLNAALGWIADPRYGPAITPASFDISRLVGVTGKLTLTDLIDLTKISKPASQLLGVTSKIGIADLVDMGSLNDIVNAQVRNLISTGKLQVIGGSIKFLGF